MPDATSPVAMSACRSLFLATPCGFSFQRRTGTPVALVDALESLGTTVREAFRRNVQIALDSLFAGHRISHADMCDVRVADGFFAVVNG